MGDQPDQNYLPFLRTYTESNPILGGDIGIFVADGTRFTSVGDPDLFVDSATLVALGRNVPRSRNKFSVGLATACLLPASG